MKTKQATPRQLVARRRNYNIGRCRMIKWHINNIPMWPPLKKSIIEQIDQVEEQLRCKIGWEAEYLEAEKATVKNPGIYNFAIIGLGSGLHIDYAKKLYDMLRQAHGTARIHKYTWCFPGPLPTLQTTGPAIPEGWSQYDVIYIFDIKKEDLKKRLDFKGPIISITTHHPTIPCSIDLRS